MRNNSVRNITMTALLVGLGIVIPMVMPIKIVIPPASFTLASHVPLFIAMFFNPGMAIAVALGTTFGFFMAMPPIIALRALSHLLFAVLGALYLQKNPSIVLQNGKFSFANWRFQLFNLVIALIHSAAEVAVVMAFNVTSTGSLGGGFYYFFILMGVGGVIHSLVDYNVAYFLAGVLSKQFDIPVFSKALQNVKKAAVTTTKDVKSVA